jgi:hypothetical protein
MNGQDTLKASEIVQIMVAFKDSKISRFRYAGLELDSEHLTAQQEIINTINSTSAVLNAGPTQLGPQKPEESIESDFAYLEPELITDPELLEERLSQDA